MIRNIYYSSYCILVYFIKAISFNRNKVAHISASFALSAVLFCNFAIILGFLSNVLNIDNIETATTGSILGLVAIYINYSLFLRKSRYKQILKEFDSDKSDNGRAWIAVLYILGSLIFAFLYASNKRQEIIKQNKMPSWGNIKYK